MHVEFLVEDMSGEVALEILIPKIIDPTHTFTISRYKGIGRLPKGMAANSDASKRILLDQLPRLLQGFGKTFNGYGATYSAAVIVVCDLDDKDLNTFLDELNALLARCHPSPEARFCIAIEEGEAWFLGDPAALQIAYPHVNMGVVNAYVQDSICGTWETLADAVHPGGSAILKSEGWVAAGKAKSDWAREISPNMDVDVNLSPSFLKFRDVLRELVS